MFTPISTVMLNGIPHFPKGSQCQMVCVKVRLALPCFSVSILMTWSDCLQNPVLVVGLIVSIMESLFMQMIYCFSLRVVPASKPWWESAKTLQNQENWSLAQMKTLLNLRLNVLSSAKLNEAMLRLLPSYSMGILCPGSPMSNILAIFLTALTVWRLTVSPREANL